MSEGSKMFLQLVAAALISGAVVSTVVGVIFKGHVTRIEQEIRSRRTWKERAVEELLGPMHVQLDRTERAFRRWNEKNLYLEAKVIKVGNETIRDLLLTRGHLVPPELYEDAGRLVEHYDVWLELFEKQRGSEEPALGSAFVFAGPEGFAFPRDAADRFQETFRAYWSDLYVAR